MGMLRCILIAISVFTLNFCQAQDTLQLASLQEISAFAIDAKGNYYIADNSLTLYKYDATGKRITNVNIKAYGNITSIDCSNAFELYVFHQDQNILVFYDNMLNVRGEIRLNDHYFNNVACVARSFDNQIWLVDLSQYKLLKINKNGEILAESPFLNNIFGNTFYPTKMWEENNDVYIVDTSNGIHQFDMYATFATTYYYPNITDALSLGTRFILKQDKQLLTYDRLLRNPVALNIVTSKNGSIVSHQNYLYSSLGSLLIRYSITN